MKKGWVIIALFAVILSLNFISADTNQTNQTNSTNSSASYNYVYKNSSQDGYTYGIANLSMKTVYTYGQPISGSFNLYLRNAPVDLLLTSGLGKITLREFLKNNSKALACESYGCTDNLVVSDSGETSKSISANNLSQTFGLVFTGNSVSFPSSSASVVIATNLPESNDIPLSITFGNSYTWKYEEPSTNYNNLRNLSYGCFNNSLSSNSYNPVFVGSTAYCQKIHLSSSKAYFLGVNLTAGSGAGVSDFSMSLRNYYSQSPLLSCNFSKPSSAVNGCFVNRTDSLPEGDYFVCINTFNSGSSNYTLKTETQGATCGYYGTSNTNSTNDYSIYVKTPKYAAVNGNVNLSSSFGSQVVSAVNNFVVQRYSSACSSGCVVPVVVNAPLASVSLSNINIPYSSNAGEVSSNKLFSVSNRVLRVNFSDVVNLDVLNWKLSTYGKYNLSTYLERTGKEKLFNQTLQMSELPVIEAIYPSNPPAGVEVILYADVKAQGNSSKYIWNFGDNSSVVVTSTPYVLHTYSNISTYYLNLTFGEGIYSNSGVFNITSVSPKDYLNISFESKRAKLLKASSDLNGLPSLYKDYVSRQVNLDQYQNTLNNLDKQRAAAYSSDDYLVIAKAISQLIVPWSIRVTESTSGPMLGNYNSFDPSLVTEIAPFTETNFNPYKSAIFSWQISNIQSTLKVNKLKLLMENNQFTDLITSYDLQITSDSSEESYLIIQESQDRLHFSSTVNTRSLRNNATGIILAPKQSLNLQFFVNGSEDLVMFVSPKLGSLVISQSVDKTCNANKVCEKSSGENYKICPSDCKPIGPTIFWIVFLLILALIVYTLLQIWYKVNYEKYLFKNRAELFNLVMFINNARLNGSSNKDIETTLLGKGWSREQIQYAIRKSEGKNPGMFEIVPVDRVIAYMERRKAEKIKNTKVVAPINPYPAQPTQRTGNNFGGATRY